MSLRHSILAILWNKSASGYDLAKTFDGSFGYFWNATHQQVYRELKTLKEEGWLSHTRITQETRPSKNVNQITEKGREELIRWLHEEVKPHQKNIGLLVKLFTGHLVDPEVMVKEIRRHKAIYEEKLKLYQSFESMLQDQCHQDEISSDEELMHQLVLRFGIHDVTAFLNWAEETLKPLEARSKSREKSSPATAPAAHPPPTLSAVPDNPKSKAKANRAG